MVVLQLLRDRQRGDRPPPPEVIIRWRIAIVRVQQRVRAEDSRELLPCGDLAEAKGEGHEDLPNHKWREQNPLLLDLVLPIVL